ncbi:MAG TPA: hypothetical protein VGK99_15210 [Acidobacteriota bacterium]|jgi:hypothetical protein
MDPSREEKLAQLDRILHSRTLQGAESLRAFLRFVVTETLENPNIQLKEYTIATQVFSRGDDYDPRIESVVRVQAGRLRSKLKEFYADEGSNDRLLIELPKGHYVPVFSYQHNGIEADAARGVASAKTKAVPGCRHNWFYGVIICTLALSLLLAGAAWHYRSEAQSLRNAQALAPSALKVFSPFWDSFLHSPEPILLAYSNTLYQGTPEGGMKLLKPLDSPGTLDAVTAPKIKLDPGFDPQIVDSYTGVGEVAGVSSLSNLFATIGRSFRVKRSLLMTWDDFKTENVVMLGSTAENLILREMPQNQDFVFRLVKSGDGSGRFTIFNLRPKTGEQSQFCTKPEGAYTSRTTEDYAVISLLRGLDDKHRLLILAGISTFGTQAAAEYVSKTEYIRELIERLNTSTSKDTVQLPKYFQVLIRVRVNGGVPVEISYVTHHVLS